MQLVIERGEPKVVLEGPFDRHTAPEIRKKLLRVIRRKGSKRVEVNLSGVTSMDTAGIAVLVEVLKLLSRKGRELRLTGMNDRATRLIHLARLDQAFKII